MIKNFKWLLLVSLTFVACTNTDENVASVEVPVTSGTASFTKYVALGDSFAAGYSDNALFMAGQKNSYPNIIAQQFAEAGGGTFTTPFMADNIGGLLLGGQPIAGVRLYFNGKAPVSVSGTSTTEVSTVITGPFNNMGVPGAKSYHLIAPGYGNVHGVGGAANPYFVRFATSSETTVLADALAQSPTFFSLWIGGNDVLGYATSGGSGVNQTGNYSPATYAGNDITDPIVFASVYDGIITGLTAKGAKGVVANLPYVNTLPYFKTVPYNPVPLTAEVAGILNANFAVYNGGLLYAAGNGLITSAEATRRTINFAAGKNAVVIVDSYLTDLSGYRIPSYRQATKDDLLVLPSSSFIGTLVGGDPRYVNGVSVPLEDKWILTKEEIAEVKVATDAYNVTIKSIADAKGLAFVDAKSIMDQLSGSGIVSNSFTLTSEYVTGGAFSLDGVHPGPRGYALIANAFTAAINAKYASTLKLVDLSSYPALYGPIIP